MSEKAHCSWCNGQFQPRRSGGSPQEFCSATCRSALWSAVRDWGMSQLQTGHISVASLKAFRSSVHAVSEPSKASGSPLGMDYDTIREQRAAKQPERSSMDKNAAMPETASKFTDADGRQ